MHNRRDTSKQCFLFTYYMNHRILSERCKPPKYKTYTFIQVLTAPYLMKTFISDVVHSFR